REERCDTQNSVPGPLLSRMIMTARAFQADAQERLRHKSGVFLYGAAILASIEIIRAYLGHGSNAGDHFTGNLVVWLIAGKVPAEVFVRIKAVVVYIQRGHHEQVAPLLRPEVGIFGTFKQAIDQALALVLSLVIQKGGNFLLGR